MNKKAQENNPIIIFGGILLALILLGYLPFFIHSITCESEVKQINSLINERDSWKNYAVSLNDTINNCSNLIQEQINNCDERINESLGNCKTENQNFYFFLQFSKIAIIIQTLSIILLFPLTINLFKIIIDFGDEWEKIKRDYRWILFFLEAISWLFLLALIIWIFVLFFTFNPLG